MDMKICSFTLLVLLLASPLLVAVRAHREEKDRFMSLDFPVTEKTTLLDAPKLNPSPGKFSCFGPLIIFNRSEIL